MCTYQIINKFIIITQSVLIKWNKSQRYSDYAICAY